MVLNCLHGLVLDFFWISFVLHKLVLVTLQSVTFISSVALEIS